MIITIKPKKMSIYLAYCKYTAQQVKEITGADVVINGTLYTFATMLPCLDFKADGVVYSDEEIMYEGYGWNNSSQYMTRTYDMAKYDNFISSCNIIKQGKALSTDGIAWVMGARPRTAIGWTADGKLVCYANPYNTTIGKVTQEMLGAGCVDAINLDGGGSTQMATKKYGNVYSPEGRRVHNYLCFWEDEPAAQPTTPAADKPVTSTKNSFWVQVPTTVTTFPLTVKGTTTLNVRALPLSASKLVKTIPYGEEFAVKGYASNWNKAWLKIADGYVYRAYCECGNPYQEPSVNISRGSIGEGARWVQWWLGQRGYRGLDGKVLGCDGNFGPNSDYALRIFQKEHGLTMDGICGAETRKKLRE